LGWQVDTGLDADRHPVLHLTNRAGAVLADPKIEAQAERPVGPKDMAVLTFRAAGDGAYQAATSLAPGQWDLVVTVRADGQVLTTTRRILVR
jgi:nitrogen fixation protein FixH